MAHPTSQIITKIFEEQVDMVRPPLVAFNCYFSMTVLFLLSC